MLTQPTTHNMLLASGTLTLSMHYQKQQEIIDIEDDANRQHSTIDDRSIYIMDKQHVHGEDPTSFQGGNRHIS